MGTAGAPLPASGPALALVNMPGNASRKAARRFRWLGAISVTPAGCHPPRRGPLCAAPAGTCIVRPNGCAIGRTSAIVATWFA